MVDGDFPHTGPDLGAVSDYPLTEDGVAQAFTHLFADRLRYCHSAGRWFEWSGKAWRADETKRAFSWSRVTCRRLAQQRGATAGEQRALAKAATCAAVERFAQADPAFAVTAATWDADPWLLGTPGGTVELRTGALRQPIQEDYITKQTAVAPAATADCPRWMQFLHEATNGDAELVRFLQQWCGYALTGDTREHALLFVYGGGGNGKSVFLNTVSRIMGEYHQVAAMETFTAGTGDKHPTDLAMLRGARLVSASETEEGRAWAEARIKALTGGDTISARFMRQDFFQFTPQFKLTVIGNHRPILKNVDEAARRRFNLAPFLFQPPVKDPTLDDKLRAEWPGILRWMIEGCLDWRQHGLLRPAVVRDATASYFAEQDSIRQWLDDCCEQGRHLSDTTASLFGSWSNWTRANGEDAGSAKGFTNSLRRLGFVDCRDPAGARNQRGFKGLVVREYRG